MDAVHDAGRLRLLSVRAKLRAAIELWLLPVVVAMLPYRLGMALARFAARVLPLYDEAARAGAAHWQAATGQRDARAWLADYRFAQLVDHADLFWSLTRSRRFLMRRLAAAAPAVVPGRAVLVLSFHYGQGLWLMHWLSAHGLPARFVSIRLLRGEAPSALHFAYARLRIAAVARLAGIAPIFTGGARREIAQVLAQGGAVYGLVDVPIPHAVDAAANASLFGHPVLLPPGLLESAAGTGAQVLVLTSRVARDGTRVIEAEPVGSVDEVSVAGLAALLERRLREAPAAWHFWHLWPRFAARAP